MVGGDSSFLQELFVFGAHPLKDFLKKRRRILYGAGRHPYRSPRRMMKFGLNSVCWHRLDLLDGMRIACWSSAASSRTPHRKSMSLEAASRARDRALQAREDLPLRGVALLDEVAERGTHEDAGRCVRIWTISFILSPSVDDGVSGPGQDFGNAAHEVAVLLSFLLGQPVPWD